MATDTLQQLSEQREQLQMKMEQESDYANLMEDKLETTTKKIQVVREDMSKHGGVNAAADNSKAVQKQIRILENRLDKALQKFNEAITANRSLREQIDTLRRERTVFDDIYRKLENELQQKKKEMANIIDQANAAYEARDSAQAQMAALKQQADKEHAEFEKEWRELGRLIDNDKRMKEFMRTKVRGSKEETRTQEVGANTEDRARKKIARNAWDTAKSLVTISASQEKVSSFEEAFWKIQAATGICDIDELVQNFVHYEDQNFSLFRYNNELSAEVEKLEQSIIDYREEFVQLSGTSGRKEDLEKSAILQTLEDKWNDIDKKAVHYEVKYQESQQTLAHVRAGVESIFRRIGCSAEDLPSGCGSTISENNMSTFLAIIENRAGELLKLYDALRSEEDEDYEGHRPARPAGQSANLNIKLPSTVEDYSDDEDEDDEDDQRPFGREELKAKTLRGISKRQKKSKMKGGAVPGEGR